MRIRFLPALVMLCMVLAALASGCLGDKSGASGGSSPPEILLDYQRTGGIAGLNDRLVVFDNGITLVSSREKSTEIELNQTSLDQIDVLFEAARFSELEGNYTSARGGADLFQYHIMYRGRTVNTEDTVVPQELEPVIEEMNRIIAGGLSGPPSATLLPDIRP